MSVAIALGAGGDGTFERLDGEVLSIVLSRAFAPGAPVPLSILLEGQPVRLRAKTIGSKRRSDGRFEVRLRVINLSRHDRARLEALVTSGSGGVDA